MIAPHHYIERETRLIKTERFCGDRWLNWAYRALWEDASWLMKALTSQRTTQVLGFFNYERPFTATQAAVSRCARAMEIDLSECLESRDRLNTLRRLFQRRWRYWQVRPMDEDPWAIVSPADARLLLGSYADDSSLFLKGKFFDYDELLGIDRSRWLSLFRQGDWAIFRLTPDKYHYNHSPVSGRVLDCYDISGRYHSCNPGPVVVEATPYSKNKRVVTIIDNVICTQPTFPAKDAKERVEKLKAPDAKYTYGNDGVGGTMQLAAERVFRSLGVKVRAIPFGGAAETAKNFLGGHVDFYGGSLPPILPHVQAGKSKCLLLNSAGANPALPEANGLSALGLETAETVLWWGLVVPKDVPEPIFETLQKAFMAAANSDRFKQAMIQQGATLRVLDGKATDAQIRSELAALGEVAKALGIQKKGQ